MNWRLGAKRLLHYLPLWVFGLGLLIPVAYAGTEFCLAHAGKPKLLYDWQEIDIGFIFGTVMLSSSALSFVWSILIHRFWRKEERQVRWTASCLFFAFPFIACFLSILSLPSHCLLVSCEVLYFASFKVHLVGRGSLLLVSYVEKKRGCEICRHVERRHNLLGIEELHPARTEALFRRLQHHVRADNRRIHDAGIVVCVERADPRLRLVVAHDKHNRRRVCAPR